MFWDMVQTAGIKERPCCKGDGGDTLHRPRRGRQQRADWRRIFIINKDIPDDCTVVGAPGMIVKPKGSKVRMEPPEARLKHE